MRIVVVFPAPLGPSKPTISPCPTPKLILSMALTDPYCFVSRSTWIIAQTTSGNHEKMDGALPRADLSSPFQGCADSHSDRIPRALPWAFLFRPLRSGRKAQLQNSQGRTKISRPIREGSGSGLLTRPSSETAGLPVPDRRRVTGRPSPNEPIPHRKQSGSEGGQDQLCSMPVRGPRGSFGRTAYFLADPSPRASAGPASQGG